MALPLPRKLSKVLPLRTNDVDEDEFDEEVEESVSVDDSSTGTDLLREMGIELESTPPEGVLTSGAVKGVNIRTYDVGGYVLEDVHQFHERVLETIKWYAHALHQRDLDVHRLATELDRSQTDYMNQKFQLELLRGQAGKALVNEDGSYVTQSQLQENPAMALQVAQAQVGELTQQHEQDQEQIRALNESLDQFQTYANQMEERQGILEQQLLEAHAQLQSSAGGQTETAAPLEDTERQQLTELLAWAAEVEVEYAKMEEQVAELTAQNAALVQQAQSVQSGDSGEVEELRVKIAELTQQVTDSQSYAEELKVYADQLQAHIDELNEYIEQLSTDVDSGGAETSVEAPETSQDAEDEAVEAKPSSYAPELPEGVVLPSQQRRHRPSEFAPAAPGAPLTSIDPEDLDKYL